MLTDRMKEIIIAGAIGDAIGYNVEFIKYKDIIKQYGESGITLYNDLGRGVNRHIASDDTQMTLFLLECFSNYQSIKNIDSNAIRISFLDWLTTQINKVDKYSKSKLVNFSSMVHPRAPGTTCLSALQNNFNLSHPVNSSKGCGAIMRTAPCAFVPDISDAIALAVVQSQVTHGHPSGYIPSEIFTALLYCILHAPDTDLLTLLNNCIDIKKGNLLAKETIDYLEGAISLVANRSYFGATIPDDIHSIGGGWMGHDALAIAVYCNLVATNFNEVIQFSANHDGDSDSTCSLAAQLWVARYGLDPDVYAVYNKLDIKDAVDHILSLDYPLFNKEKI